MHIAVIRKWLTPESTISEVRINGDRVCYGLEDAIREVDGQPVESWKIKGETAIPYGAYQLEITRSTRWKKDMLQVMDVPGFSGIRIHAGNTSADTEGCLLVGDIKGDDFISNSRPALVRVFGAVQAALHRGDEVTIEFQRE